MFILRISINYDWTLGPGKLLVSSIARFEKCSKSCPTAKRPKKQYFAVYTVY